ncbi:hypothetical protein D3C86_1537690 [compost metagenome]
MAHPGTGEVAVAGAGEVITDGALGPGGVDIPARPFAKGLVAVGRQAIQTLADLQCGAGLCCRAVAAEADACVGRQRDFQARGRAALCGDPAARIGDVVAFVVIGAGVERARRHGRPVGAAGLAPGGDAQAVGEAVAGEPGFAAGGDEGFAAGWRS